MVLQLFCALMMDRDRLDRLEKALQPVDATNQDVLDAALLELGQHGQPELSALGGLEPEAEQSPAGTPSRGDHEDADGAVVGAPGPAGGGDQGGSARRR